MELKKSTFPTDQMFASAPSTRKETLLAQNYCRAVRAHETTPPMFFLHTKYPEYEVISSAVPSVPCRSLCSSLRDTPEYSMRISRDLDRLDYRLHTDKSRRL